jgi:hypothetical protein
MDGYGITPTYKICHALGKFATDLNKAVTMLNNLESNNKESIN